MAFETCRETVRQNYSTRDEAGMKVNARRCIQQLFRMGQRLVGEDSEDGDHGNLGEEEMKVERFGSGRLR
jgi:hypothetical protein